MSIKEDNERILVTLNKETIKKLDFLSKFLKRSRSKTINVLIDMYYDINKLMDL